MAKWLTFKVPLNILNNKCTNSKISYIFIWSFGLVCLLIFTSFGLQLLGLDHSSVQAIWSWLSSDRLRFQINQDEDFIVLSYQPDNEWTRAAVFYFIHVNSTQMHAPVYTHTHPFMHTHFSHRQTYIHRKNNIYLEENRAFAHIWLISVAVTRGSNKHNENQWWFIRVSQKKKKKKIKHNTKEETDS